jgi:diguanylate cyclase (GGDEF)-like protein
VKFKVPKIDFVDPRLPDDVGRRLLDMLYSSPRSTVAYVCGLGIMVIALWRHTGDHLLIAGSIATIVLIAFRIAFDARAKSSSAYLPTLLVFGCIYSVLLAALVVRAFAIDDRLAIALISVAAAGYLSGVTNRAAAVPTLAIPHVSTLFAPLVVTVAIASGGEYWAAAVLLLLYWIGCIQLIMTMHRRIRAQLIDEHDLANAALTGLRNRRAFDIALVQRLGSGSAAIVAMIDLDRFKQVNDTHGHDVGDELLKAVAKRLRADVTGDDLVARLGGDEFAVLFDPAANITDATRAAEAIAGRIEQAVKVGTIDLQVGVSVGLAVAMSGDTARSLKKRADERLYDAKRAGRMSLGMGAKSPRMATR